MRVLNSVTVLIFIGCASGPKPRAAVELRAVRRAPPTLDASLPDSSLPDSSSSDSSPGPSPSDSSSPSESPMPSTAAERRECAARGGIIQPVCMLGELACVVRYRDGGKRCSDKRECAGECLYEGPAPPPQQATGRCQRTTDPCGCKAPIHHGSVEPAFCLD